MQSMKLIRYAPLKLRIKRLHDGSSPTLSPNGMLSLRTGISIAIAQILDFMFSGAISFIVIEQQAQVFLKAAADPMCDHLLLEYRCLPLVTPLRQDPSLST